MGFDLFSDYTMGVTTKVQINKVPAIITIVLLLLAVMTLPYGFYTLLRIVTTGTAIYYAYLLYEQEKNAGSWFFGMVFIAILFNPLLPIYLTKEIWVIFDFLIAAVFSLFLLYFKK